MTEVIVPEGSTTTPERAPEQLRTAAANSVKWAMLQMIGATGGRMVFTFALARLLGPYDFGIIAQAMIYIAFATLLLDQGFGSALVQRRNLHGADVRSVATLNLILSVGLCGLTLLLAPAVAQFFRTPELTNVLRVLGVGLIVKGLTIVPLMMSRREFQFRRLAVLQTLGVVVGGIAGLIGVALGIGYWALVVQVIVGDALVLVGLLWTRGFPRFGLRVQRLRSMFGFSIALLGAQLLTFVGHNADNVVVGRVLGPTALAYYAFAFRLQRFPMQLFGSTVNEVSLPIFSRLQNDPDRREAWFLTATRFVVLLTWPILVLLTVGADVAIPLVFGESWTSAVRPLQLLSLGALAMASRYLLTPLCSSCGRTDLVFRWSLLHVGLAVVAFIVSVHWGIGAVAASLGLVGIALAVPQTLNVCRELGMSWRRLLGAHVPGALGCVALAGLWRGTAVVLDHGGIGPAPILLIATLIGLAGYALVIVAVWPTVGTEARTMLRLAKERKAT